jgi:hypothetical protein
MARKTPVSDPTPTSDGEPVSFWRRNRKEIQFLVL